MANIILDETFSIAPSGSFATMYAQSGTPTATHNPTYQSIDLVHTTASHALWSISSLGYMSTGEVEIDIELVTDGVGLRKHVGIYMSLEGGASAGVGVSFDHLDTSWYLTPWTAIGTAGTSIFINAETSSLNYVQTSRRLLSISWIPNTINLSKSVVECRVDGNIVGSMSYNAYTSIRPGIHFYQVSLARLHGIKVWDAPRVPMSNINVTVPVKYPILYNALSGSSIPTLSKYIIRLAKLENFSDNPLIYATNITIISRYIPGQAGSGIIQGTVAQYTGPVATRVFLFTTSMLLISETMSDAVTGSYTFYNVDPIQKYVVVAMDYSGTYNAVIADRLTPT